jgi:hypothetical protein
MTAIKNFFDTIEQKDEDKENTKVIGEMVDMIARLKLVGEATATQAGIQGNTLQSAQINMQMQQIMQQLQVMQNPAPPVTHMEEQATRPVNYPQGDTINPQRIEGASSGAPTQPQLSGAYQ